MLVTDIGDKICKRQVCYVGDRFNTFKNHQRNEKSRRHVCDQHLKSVTNTTLSPTSL